ncbi:MAG: hypothetical protein ABIG95_03815 [Candidatus Woesearchaeota archaeon]
MTEEMNAMHSVLAAQQLVAEPHGLFFSYEIRNRASDWLVSVNQVTYTTIAHNPLRALTLEDALSPRNLDLMTVALSTIPGFSPAHQVELLQIIGLRPLVQWTGLRPHIALWNIQPSYTYDLLEGAYAVRENGELATVVENPGDPLTFAQLLQPGSQFNLASMQKMFHKVARIPAEYPIELSRFTVRGLLIPGSVLSYQT